MKHRELLVCCVVAFAGGCTARSADSSSSTLPTTAPVARSPIQVRYDPSPDPDELTPERRTELFNLASEFGAGTCRSWFLNVRYNKNWIFVADLYFAPDRSSPRIRKGFCAHVESWSDLLSVIREGPSEHTPRYAQISSPQSPFGNRLEVPSAEVTPFDPANHFFDKPAELGDEDLVAVVDLVRPLFEKNGSGAIYRIEEKGGGIRVFSGASQGSLLGGGRFLDVRRKSGGGFELVDGEVGVWTS